MALRELLLKLGVDVDKQGEKKALSTTNKIKAGAAAAAVAFATIAAAKVFSDITEEVRGLGDEIDKTSKQLGITTQALQEMRFAADLAGVSGKVMSDALAKVQRNASEAARGNKLLAEDFAKLGVNVRDSSGNLKSAEQLTQEAADGFSKLSNDTEKVAVSMNLFGRSGKLLIPLLSQGSEAIAAQRKEARELGGVLSQELVDSSAQLTDDQARLKFAMKGLKIAIATEVMPVLIELTQALVQIAKDARGPLTSTLQFLERVFFGVRTGVIFLRDGIRSMGKSLADAGDDTTRFGKVMQLVGNNMFKTAGLVFAAWLLATSPLLLMIVLFAAIGLAIFAVIEDLQKMGDTGEGFFATLIKGFTDLLAKVDGDWAAAMKEVFFNVMNFWFGTSRETFDKIVKALEDTVEFLIAPFRVFVNLTMNILETLVSFISDTFSDGISTAFSNLWTNVKTTAVQFIADLRAQFRSLFDFVEGGLELAQSVFGDDDKQRGGTIQRVAGTLRDTAASGAIQQVAGTLQRGAAAGNVTGVTSAITPVVPGPGGDTTSLVNQPSIEVNVDARDRQSPEAIGQAIIASMKSQNEENYRGFIQAYVIAKGGV